MFNTSGALLVKLHAQHIGMTDCLANDIGSYRFYGQSVLRIRHEEDIVPNR